LNIHLKTRKYIDKNQLLTHAYAHLLADVQFGGFAPAFTLSFHDSEYARKPQVPIPRSLAASRKKKKERRLTRQQQLPKTKKIRVCLQNNSALCGRNEINLKFSEIFRYV
jgi:hypothetical protein